MAAYERMGNAAWVRRPRVQAWRFFANRIPYEEALLVEFFGTDYVRYRAATPTWLPYID